MIVEFIGLPASGKSTLAESVYDELKKKKMFSGVEVIYPLRRLYQKNWITRNILKLLAVIKYCIFNSKNLYRVYIIVAKSQQENGRDVFKLIFNLLFYLYNINKYKNSSKYVIFDEGLAHHMWAISLYSQVNDLSYLKNFVEEYMSIVIKVECSLNIVQERILSRKSNNRRLIRLADNLQKSYDKLNHILNMFMKDKQNLIVVRNESECDIAKNTIAIAKQITDINKII